MKTQPASGFTKAAFAILFCSCFFNAYSQIPGCHPYFTFTITGDTLSFTDASTFDVGPQNTSWVWDFGDGDSSMLQNPQHIFPINLNVYIICLTVSNCGVYPGTCCTETWCDTIPMSDVVTGLQDLNQENRNILIVPNPSPGNFEIAYTLPKPADVLIEIFNVNGKLVFSEQIRNEGGNQQLKFSEGILTSPGVYLFRMTESGKKIASALISKL